MRLRWSLWLSALLSAIHIEAGHGREAIYSEPVNLHAARAAHSADVAEQAATVAANTAEHTEDMVRNTASALRLTRDALKKAGASQEKIDSVGREADMLEHEAGMESSAAEEGERMLNKEAGRVSEDVSVDGHERTYISSEGADAGAERGIDVNSEMAPDPSHGSGPFGQEDAAKDMTEDSVKQSDRMIDRIEKAQGMEAKRSVYRALTKLRGATITSYDGMARGHLKNVDNYNMQHKWREEHHIRHLAEEESDTEAWAFPSRKTTQVLGTAPAPAV